MAETLQAKIRVLHIITRLDPGGSTVNTLETVARLDRSVFDVELVAGRGAGLSGEAAEFLNRHSLYCLFIDSLVRDVHPLKDLLAFIRLCRIIHQGKYDIVHTHSSKAGILGRWAARVCGVKKIVHTPHGHVFYGYFSNVVTKFFVLLERSSAKITTTLVALTDKGIEEHLAFGVGRREQWVVIPSGIDRTVFQYSAQARQELRLDMGLEECSFVFLSVARLDVIKNAQILVEAFSRLAHDHPAARLVFVGDGPQRDFLRGQARRYGVAQKVVFAGYRKDVARVLCIGDVFVMASANEGMGRAVLEAMAVGLPVIVSRAGGLPSIVRDGQEGLLADPMDVRAWEDAMRRMIDSPDLRRKMSVASGTRVSERFTVETMVRKIEEVYRS
jgi:glycosyltransferase involved in cell wall biosynthesis